MIFTAYKVYLHKNFLNPLKKISQSYKKKKNAMVGNTKKKKQSSYKFIEDSKDE